MRKVAIVGVEGSGKTVMLAGLGDLYMYPDEDGYFLAPKNFGTAAYVAEKIARMRKGEWPTATADDEMQGLDWTLKRQKPGENGRPDVVCEVSFLDFAGEVYRAAYGISSGGDASLKEQVEELKRYVRGADDLIVLINLRDVITNGLRDKRVQEAMWITKSILDGALDEKGGTYVSRAAIALSQADSYAETIKACGGAVGVLRKYLPHVANDYSWLDVFAVSAVDKTVLDDDGNVVPAADFTTQGLLPILKWIRGGHVTIGGPSGSCNVGNREQVRLKFNAKFSKLKSVFPEIGIPHDIYQLPDGGWQMNCGNAAITLQPGKTELHEVHGGIWTRWDAEGGVFNEKKERGWLGYPISDEQDAGNTRRNTDRISYFENGIILWNSRTNETFTLKYPQTVVVSEKSALPDGDLTGGLRLSRPSEPAGTNQSGDTHKKVQLWENGPYWAETNIGAEQPWESGYYFWWGDIIGYKRENDGWVASDGSSSGFLFGENNIPTHGKDNVTLQRYGWITADGVLVPNHDAAHVNWGGEWRMPTKQELADLCKRCDWSWTATNGVNGYVVRGRGDYADTSIFLPVAGFGRRTSLYYAGSSGSYWSSVPGSDDTYVAWSLDVNSSDHDTYRNDRSYGQAVRPIQGFTK